MRIIKLQTLKRFWENHKDAEEPLKAWFKEAECSSWQTFQDIKNRFGNADVLPGNRVVFNIKGNKYRLIVKIHYNIGVIYIRFVGTHAEYNKTNAVEI